MEFKQYEMVQHFPLFKADNTLRMLAKHCT